MSVFATASVCVADPQRERGGFYVGTTLGLSSASLSSASEVYPDTLSGALVSTDRTRSAGAWQLSIGLRFNEYLALEAGGGMLGRFSITDSIGQDSIENRLKIADFRLDAIGHLPLHDRFDLTAGAGLARVGVRSEAITGGSTTLLPGVSTQNSEWRTVLHERLGAGYLLTARLTLTLEYDHYGHLENPANPTGVSNVDTWSLGANFRF